VESYYAAKTGKYRLFSLTRRFNQSLLPEVTVVDMRDKAGVSSHPAFSYALLEALHDNLKNGGQSILLLNRRGHSTTVRCEECGAPAMCRHCSVALTYHAANDSLLCHYCGYTLPMKSLAPCERCGGALTRCSGLGTQRLEEELRILFPEARVLRVDADATQGRLSHERLFGAFAAGEYDIMAGTQMVAKGLNFPAVTLVGVLGAEQSLYSGDFRGFERTFSLLTQVVGRGGRFEKQGRAIVQSYAPDNRCVTLAARQSYPDFFEEEIKLRRLHLYPPFCTLCCAGFSGEIETEVKAAAQKFAESFKALAAESYPDLPLRLLGPTAADILKVAGKYRYRLLIKCKNSPRLRELLRSLYGRFLKENKRISIYIDLNCTD
jgi:primosomal protein N' (replication factor Y)